MKKNKIFQNKIEKEIGNNQKSFSIDNLEEDNLSIEEDDTLVKNNLLTVDEKLKRLFNRNGYIFNVDLEIKTNKKTYNTKIAGRVKNSLITLDNDIIYIPDIIDIIIKK